MSGPDIFNELKMKLKGGVAFQEPMAHHTSWHIGGPAEIFAEPAGMEDLFLLLDFAANNEMPLTIIGGGTNLLVKDAGIKGIVVKIGSGFTDIETNGVTITAGGGARVSRLAAAARDAGIGGFEFIYGIPGTVGGALFMNAGAYGFSAGDILIEADCVDLKGNLICLDRDSIEWGYRKSGLQDRGLIVVKSVFRGYRREKKLIEADMNNYLGRRKASQPLEYPNAGSIFKNPPGNYAGRLIEESGCRGMRVGDAQVSDKHANFIVNRGKARADEVLKLISMVSDKVFSRSGIRLEAEIRVLG